MEITTIIGIIMGLTFCVIGIMLDGEIMSFVDMPSIMIVFGGTISATIVSYPLSHLKNTFSIIKHAFRKSDIDLYKDIEMIIGIANIARREGLLALEDQVGEMNNPFLKKGIMLVVDGSDPELIKNIMQTELVFLQERHAQGQAVLESMSSYAPAFGMIGTLIGLINMLKKLDDPSGIGPSMAVALVTTFYGVILANLIFTPLSKKLKMRSSLEFLQKELMLEGLLSIQDGENPRIIKDKLTAFISRGEVARAEAKGGISNSNAEVRG